MWDDRGGSSFRWLGAASFAACDYDGGGSQSCVNGGTRAGRERTSRDGSVSSPGFSPGVYTLGC